MLKCPLQNKSLCMIHMGSYRDVFWKSQTNLFFKEHVFLGSISTNEPITSQMDVRPTDISLDTSTRMKRVTIRDGSIFFRHANER